MKYSRNLVVGLTVIATAIAAALNCWYYVARTLPLHPGAETYANNVRFQIAAWLLTRLPLWIVGLFVAIAFEVTVFHVGAKGTDS